MFPEKLEKKDLYFYHNKYCFYSQYNLTRGFVEKNYQTNMHEQEFYEINIIIKGSGMHYIKENRIHTKVGDVFIIPPYTDHGYYGGTGFDVYHILLSNEFMNRYSLELQQLPAFYTLFGAEPLMRSTTKTPLHLSLSSNQLKSAMPLLDILQTYTNYSDPYECFKSTHTTMSILMYLCEIYSYNFSQNKTLNKDESFMKTLSYIHAHYSEKITLDYLVSLSQMSRSAFINKFKKICNCPPLTYLNKTRVNEAEKLLLNSNISITEVAERTGFYDCSHFAKTFTTLKGISPFSFRKTKT